MKKIPNAFLKYLDGFPKKVVLPNRMGKCWHVEMAYTDSMVLFANGWKNGCVKRETSANVSIDMEVEMEEKEDDEDDML
ncbi:hypothetical protein Patl1_04065 [Pistacia atlantica]|uniref:Uncharacterized protein n=1 Tax=Pistacia atlantica TaxID=434234 RepID=A0ACC1BW03_9ROSI|nr:hypothetical protein Patl1_04065 [Pistacia atlantica]